MTESRDQLKTHFTTGSAPTQSHFTNFIDSCLNKSDDKLTINPDGNSRHLGIGSDDPQSPLSVRANEATQALVSFEDETGKNTWRIKHIQGEEQPGLSIGEHEEGEAQFFIRPGGNVGIGTTNPLANLQVSDQNGPWIRLEGPSGASAIEQKEHDLIISSANGKVVFGAGHQPDGRPSTGENTAFVIGPSGTVGIGTEDPEEKLHVADGKVMVGNSNGDAPTLLISSDGIQGMTGEASGNLLLNLSGGNVGIGTDDPQSKVHIHDLSGEPLFLSGGETPSLKFLVEGQEPAELRYKDENTLCTYNTRLHIESGDDEGLSILADNHPTIHLERPNDEKAFIRLTEDALVIQNGTSENPGRIALNGVVAFGTEQPLAEFHIASENDNLLMLEGPFRPSLKFKDAEGHMTEIAFENGQELTLGGVGESLEKINLRGNLNVSSVNPNTLFSIVATETPEIEIPEDSEPPEPGAESETQEPGTEPAEGTEVPEQPVIESTTYGVFMEALSDPYLKFQGFEEKTAAIEFLSGNQLAFHNGEGGDLEKFTFQGQVDIVNTGSQAQLHLQNNNNSLLLAAQDQPKLTFRGSDDGTAGIQLSTGKEMHVDDGEGGDLTGVFIHGNLSVSGELQVAGMALSNLEVNEGITAATGKFGDVSMEQGSLNFQNDNDETGVSIQWLNGTEQTLSISNGEEGTINKILLKGNVVVGDETSPTNLEVSGRLQVKEGLASQQGKVIRDFFTHNIKSATPDPIHIVTNLNKSSKVMYRILIEGYNLGQGACINSDVVGHAMATIKNAQANDYADGVSISQYYNTDGNLVLKLEATDTKDIGFSASAWFTNSAGQAFDINVLNVIQQETNL